MADGEALDGFWQPGIARSLRASLSGHSWASWASGTSLSGHSWASWQASRARFWQLRGWSRARFWASRGVVLSGVKDALRACLGGKSEQR